MIWDLSSSFSPSLKSTGTRKQYLTYTCTRIITRSTLLFPDVVRIVRSNQEVYQAPSTTPQERAAALGRAQTLFGFLNLNADRFFTSVHENAAAEAAKKKKKKSSLLSRAMYLFDEAARAAEKAKQAQLMEEERERIEMIQELGETCWVPVLAEKPLPFLPWRKGNVVIATAGATTAAGPSALVTPAHARLAEELWYSSAIYGIIPAETYVAEQVKDVFGWKRYVKFQEEIIKG